MLFLTYCGAEINEDHSALHERIAHGKDRSTKPKPKMIQIKLQPSKKSYYAKQVKHCLL